MLNLNNEKIKNYLMIIKRYNDVNKKYIKIFKKYERYKKDNFDKEYIINLEKILKTLHDESDDLFNLVKNLNLVEEIIFLQDKNKKILNNLSKH